MPNYTFKLTSAAFVTRRFLFPNESRNSLLSSCTLGVLPRTGYKSLRVTWTLLPAKKPQNVAETTYIRSAVSSSIQVRLHSPNRVGIQGPKMSTEPMAKRKKHVQHRFVKDRLGSTTQEGSPAENLMRCFVFVTQSIRS